MSGLYDELKKLQNGSDIRGIAMDGVPGEARNLTDSAAKLLTRGFVVWLEGHTGKAATELTVAIGRDPRLSGEALAKDAAAVMTASGVKVINCGLASTPAMFMSTQFAETNCDGAIMITASHLPWNRNGFKYFTKDGGLDKPDIAKLIEYAAKSEDVKAADSVPAADNQLMELYAAHLRELIIKGVAMGDTPLSGLHIVVDAGNGAGGFFAAKVLAPLGADLTGSLYLEPDGHFPNHAPNPEDKAAMRAISTAVLEAKADLGIIFDTDVDRSAAVDENGREIARNGIVAMAAALIAGNHPGTTVVTDSITSDFLPEFLENRLGLRHLRFKRGYKNVINKAIELNAAGTDCQLAIETSGHAAYKENYFLDDGAYLATKIVIRAAQLHHEGKGISTVISELSEPAEAREVRIPVLAEDFATAAEEVLTGLKAYVAETGTALTLVEPNYEGVRIHFDEGHGDGWCLLRKSLHDPLMPLNLESNTAGGTDVMASILRRFLEKYTALDISKL